MRRRGDRVLRSMVGVAALATVATALGCTGTSDGPSASRASTSPPTSGRSAAPVTTKPVGWTASIVGEHEVSPGYRQGLARDSGGTGWVFSTNNGLYRTDEAFVPGSTPTDRAELVIPADLAAQGYDHIGDIDIADGVLWAPIEKGDKSTGQQVMARFDPVSLHYTDSFVVPQHHNSFVAVGADGVIYSTDYFDDDTLLRYRFTGSAFEKLEPLRMSRKVDSIQGADVADGAIWLSTDDDHDGLYRVDLVTGQVGDLGSMGHVDGEGEGIDAQSSAPGAIELHPLSIDGNLVPVRVIDVVVAPAPG